MEKGQGLFTNPGGEVAATGSLKTFPWLISQAYTLILNVLTAHQGCRIENQLRRKSHEIAPFCTKIRMQHACNIWLKATVTPSSARRPSPKPQGHSPKYQNVAFVLTTNWPGIHLVSEGVLVPCNTRIRREVRRRRAHSNPHSNPPKEIVKIRSVVTPSRVGNQLCFADLCPTNKHTKSATSPAASRGH